MDLIEDDEGAPTGASNAEPYSVSELSGAVKRTVEDAFSHVRVRGEIGRVSQPRSGHVYLDLKDDRATISGVIWKGQAARLSHRPEEGLEVIATGRLTTFPGQSKYQIVIEDIRPAGAGALMAQLEARRRKLAAEGLFDEGRKQPIPFLPEVIGVVTSPTGAVIRDILHRLRDRFPRRVLVWPVRVQGQGAADEVAAAIRGFDALTPGGAVPRPDLVIVARGGRVPHPADVGRGARDRHHADRLRRRLPRAHAHRRRRARGAGALGPPRLPLRAGRAAEAGAARSADGAAAAAD